MSKSELRSGGTVGHLLLRAFQRYADAEMIVGDGERLSYSQMSVRTARMLSALNALGLESGHAVALLSRNRIDVLAASYAAYIGGIRITPLSPLTSEDDLAFMLEDGKIDALIVDDTVFAAKGLAMKARLPALRHLLSLGPMEGAVDLMAAAANAEPAPLIPRASPDDVAVVGYTGGTTGMPKGVMWRHEDIFFGAFGGGDFNGERIRTPEEIADKARNGRLRCLPACPFMHGTAHWIAFTALLSGGTVVISPDRTFDATRLWGVVAAERVNLLVIVGDPFARPTESRFEDGVLADEVAGCSVILSGGAILSPAVKTAIVGHLPGTMVIDGYGASETGGQGRSVTVAGQEPSAVPRFRVGPQTTVLGEDLRPAPPGTVGLLARRGHIPLGYFGDPEKTAATFPTIDGVRWSVPGDHAIIEADGSITLLGRGSVSINTGGEKVYPEEVEAALKGHPAVFDAIVVATPDERWGERVVAVVALRDGHITDFASIDEHGRHHVAGYKAPRAIVTVPTIERSPSGKPDYRWGREVAIAGLRDAAQLT